MEKEGNEIEVLEKNQLIVGNDDSILLFGCEAQQQLREFSKAISNQLLNSNGDLEYLIYDILNEIDDFQVLIEKKVGIFSGSNEKKRERLIKKYNDVLVYIDKMELALKLQEAQLIKDSKLFEELSRCIDETLSSLQTAISYGNDVVNQKPNYNNYNEIMEDLARKLGAEENNGTYLYRHARNSVGGNSAYFSWRFIVNDIEYLIFVKDNDSSECWKVGVTRYNNN